ncbi:MAG: hypothetical protein QOG98_2933 [Pseudonocardiales bacterium]|nr:hypothetical protein [Pseudonocardiales bacterium]
MDRLRHSRTAFAAALTAAVLATGCGAGMEQAVQVSASATPVLTSAPTTQPIPAAPAKGSHGGRVGSGHGSSGAAAGLPADWPQDVPVPQGDISGSTGSAGRWTVLILATGSAAAVLRSTAAFYRAAGFTAVTDSILNKGNRQLTLVAENRDHSANETNLVIAVTTK